MSVHIVDPFHLAVVIQYSLNLGSVSDETNKSLSSFFFKEMLSKINQQYVSSSSIKIENNDNISELDKRLYKELEDNDYFDVLSYRSCNFKFLARLLCTSNYHSYKNRYFDKNGGHCDIELIIQKVIDQKDKALVTANEISAFQFIKLVDCIDYQCCEMMKYENSLCKSYTHLMTHFAVRHNDDYKSSEWELLA